MINQLCAICEKNNFDILYPENFDIKKINSHIFSARRLPDRVHYRIVKCKNCDLVYSTPILEYDKIEKLYKKSFTSYDEHLENLKETYSYYLKELNEFREEGKKKFRGDLLFEPDLRKLNPRFSNIKTVSKSNDRKPGELSRQEIFSNLKNSKKLKLLEIGCGNGFFLEEAANQGYQVYGIEPGKPSVDKAKPEIKKNIIVDIFKPGQFKKNFFDVICCFQTFDHVPNPNDMLSECYKILKEGGLMLFLNHDVGALTNRLMGEKSPIIDIEHTYLFDKKTIALIFEKHRFKVLEVKSAFNIHHLSYWLHLFPLPNFLKLSLLKFLDLTGLGKIKIKMYPGNLILFARK